MERGQHNFRSGVNVACRPQVHNYSYITLSFALLHFHVASLRKSIQYLRGLYTFYKSQLSTTDNNKNKMLINFEIFSTFPSVMILHSGGERAQPAYIHYKKTHSAGGIVCWLCCATAPPFGYILLWMFGAGEDEAGFYRNHRQHYS